MSIQIVVNGQNFELNGQSIADVVVQMEPNKPFAVAVNTQFVPKGSYETVVLQAGDVVDIVNPIVGG